MSATPGRDTPMRAAMPFHSSARGVRFSKAWARATTRRSSSSVAVHSAQSARCRSQSSRSAPLSVPSKYSLNRSVQCVIILLL